MSRVAAVDCGTNSIRLLIADIDQRAGTLEDVVRTMEIVRLGEGVDETGELSEAALERTFAVCDRYAEMIKESGAGAVRFVATSASRDASNRDRFVQGVQSRFDVQPEVIAGQVEARLSFMGATRSLPDQLGDRTSLVLDIGGGSTEFVVGNRAVGVQGERSVDVGCVRMTERRLHSNPPTDEEVAAATADIDAAIAQAGSYVNLADAEVLVGLAGSVTTLSAIHQDLPEYDPDRIHGSWLSRADVARISHQLLHQTHDERAAIPSMHPGRVDVIAGGALILERVLAATNLDGVLVSEHDILDGIAWSLSTSSGG